MWATDTSPRARRDFLDSLGVRGRAQAVQLHVEQESGDTPAFTARLAAAERLVEACEKDRDDAYAELRYARADEPEQARYRAVTPERLDAVERVTRATAAASQAESALEHARLRLARELEAFDRIAEPPSAWAFDDSPGLSAADRDRDY